MFINVTKCATLYPNSGSRSALHSPHLEFIHSSMLLLYFFFFFHVISFSSKCCSMGILSDENKKYINKRNNFGMTFE